MNKILILVILLVTFSSVQAQTSGTRIDKIVIDGKEIEEDYKFFFQSKEQWIEAERTLAGFVIPTALKNEEYFTILVIFGKHKLSFSNIHASKFSEDWIIGIDKKPFSEEYVKPEEAKTLKRVYYIQFLGKSEVTQMVVKERIDINSISNVSDNGRNSPVSMSEKKKTQIISAPAEKIETAENDIRDNFNKYAFFSKGSQIEAKKGLNEFIAPAGLEDGKYQIFPANIGKHKSNNSNSQTSNFNQEWITGISKEPFLEEYVESRHKEH